MTQNKPIPGTPEFLTAVRKALEYDSEAGVLRWADGGERAGERNGEPVPVLFQGRKYWPEQLAWLIKTGDLLGGASGCDVGFRNGIDKDLRWQNLFDARADRVVTLEMCGCLFVLRNGEEQVVVDESIERVLDIARSILEHSVASMKGV